MITESWRHKSVWPKPMRHIDFESFSQILKNKQIFQKIHDKRNNLLTIVLSELKLDPQQVPNNFP